MFFEYKGVFYDSAKLESKRKVAEEHFLSSVVNDSRFVCFDESLLFDEESLLFFEIKIIPLEKQGFFEFSF